MELSIAVPDYKGHARVAKFSLWRPVHACLPPVHEEAEGSDLRLESLGEKRGEVLGALESLDGDVDGGDALGRTRLARENVRARPLLQDQVGQLSKVGKGGRGGEGSSGHRHGDVSARVCSTFNVM